MLAVDPASGAEPDDVPRIVSMVFKSSEKLLEYVSRSALALVTATKAKFANGRIDSSRVRPSPGKRRSTIAVARFVRREWAELKFERASMAADREDNVIASSIAFGAFTYSSLICSLASDEGYTAEEGGNRAEKEVSECVRVCLK